MVNAIMENENKSFTNISFFSELMVAEHCACHYNLRKTVKVLAKPFLFSTIVFNMMRFLAIHQFKAGKTIIKESYRSLT